MTRTIRLVSMFGISGDDGAGNRAVRPDAASRTPVTGGFGSGDPLNRDRPRPFVPGGRRPDARHS
ncbi:hypothetical protein [Streptosporangium sp. NPDC020145]|uniref:Uncharacterized protein n=1 Tax=Streptosporangium jomthongense TaxID=1193683 RepID=A0ABV8FAW9_9ACTN